MKKTASRILTMALLTAVVFTVKAQTGVSTGTPYGHGEDSVRCMRNTSLYSTYYDNKDYSMALKFWRQVYNECPSSSKNIYIRGEVMYKELYKKSGEKAYIDTVLMILSQRIQYYNEPEANSLRKAMALYELGGNDPDYAMQSFSFLKNVLETAPQYLDNAYSTLLVAMAAKCYALKTLEASEVVTMYAKAMDIVDARLASKPNSTAYLKAKNEIDAIFQSSGTADCSSLETLFMDQVKNNPTDTVLIKKVLKMLSDARCKDSDLFYIAATNLYNSKKSADAASELAEMNYSRKQYSEAEKYYDEAVQLESDDKVKSQYLTKLASLKLTSDDKQSARDFAKKAYSLDNTNGNALFIIGEAYAGARIGEPFDNQTVYWVVVDYLARAKNTDPSLESQVNERIAMYSKYFPTKEEAFFRSIIEEGAPYQIGSWINETTTIRFRK